VIVARLGSGIEKIEDLKDKRVATPQLGNTQDISARRYLTEVLRQPNAKNVIPVPNAEQAGMMARGQIDAAWAPEPWGQRLIVEAGAKLVAEEKDLWPNAELGLTLVVGSPELLSEQPELVRKVLGVHKSFTARLAASPDALLPELGDALFALTGKELPEGVLPAAIGRVKFTDEIPEETLKTYAQWTFALGFERAAADTAGLLDRSFLGATVAEP
jgi:NitT/TauT family transport system substrate-binding protein